MIVAKEHKQVWSKGLSIRKQDRTVIKKFKRRKIYARFKEKTCEADSAEIKSLSSKSKNINYLLCVIDVFNKYAWC